MIVPGFACAAISRTASSMAVMLVALPAPSPKVLVGVLTARKIMSACDVRAVSQVKNRLGRRFRVFVVFAMGSLVLIVVLSLVARTTLTRPCSCTGRCGDVHFWMRRGSRSRTLTVIVGLFSAKTAAVGPPVQVSNKSLSTLLQQEKPTYITRTHDANILHSTPCRRALEGDITRTRRTRRRRQSKIISFRWSEQRTRSRRSESS